MKEKIIEILKAKAECSCNIHADFDNVDEMQFESVAEEIVKLLNLHIVTQQRELLIAFLMEIDECYGMHIPEEAAKCVDSYLKGNL